MRWTIAKFLDRFVGFCWADLVMWANYPELHPFGEILELVGSAGRCARSGEIPYCGKCAVTGKHYERSER